MATSPNLLQMMDRFGEDIQDPMMQLERSRGHIELQTNFNNAQRERREPGSNSVLLLREATPPMKLSEDQEMSPQPNDCAFANFDLSPAQELIKEVRGQVRADVRPDSNTLHTDERMSLLQPENDLLQHYENTQPGVQRSMVQSKPIWKTMGQRSGTPDTGTDPDLLKKLFI
eukprot:c17102_g1_i2 orf=402-917(-)